MTKFVVLEDSRLTVTAWNALQYELRRCADAFFALSLLSLLHFVLLPSILLLPLSPLYLAYR